MKTSETHQEIVKRLNNSIGEDNYELEYNPVKSNKDRWVLETAHMVNGHGLNITGVAHHSSHMRIFIRGIK